jgi:hypothetical protein
MNDKNLFKEDILISRDVDATIEQIVEYILRDYIFSWATKCVPDDEFFRESLAIKIK